MKSVLLHCLIGWLTFGLVACKVQKYPPELWKPAPSAGAIGQDITLQGSQFGDNPAVTFTSTPLAGTATMPVSLTTIPAVVKTKTDASILVTVPRQPIGIAQIRVSNEQGITDPVAFTVLQPAPLLGSITPGNALPGTTVRLTGDYLDQLKNVKIGANVFYPGISSVTVVSAQSVDVTLPAYIPRGPQAVSVETNGGVASGIDFIVSGTPGITGFTPKRVKSGTEVVISGRNLTDGVVRINGLITDKTLASSKDTEIRIVVPPTATSGKVTVTVFDKLVATSTDSLFVVGAPVLSPTALSITEGIKGDVLTLTGTNLLDVSAVAFGGTPAAFRVLSNTQLETTVPDRTVSGTVPISVTSLGGSTIGTQLFLVILPPANLTTDLARQARGKDVAIRGQNLDRITSVTISGRPATITSRAEGVEVRVTVPADATTGVITVANRAGAVSVPKPLTIILPPTITDFTKKAAVGSRVILKGTYLLNASVYFSGNSYPALDDGKNEDGERWVVVTGDAQTGPIRVANDAGEVSTAESFTVLRLASIVDFTPKAGKVGSEVTISGQNLIDVTEIRFSSGKSATAVFRRSGSNLVATVPAGAVDGTICLLNGAGTACTTTAFNVQLPPATLDFTPVTAKVGATITITGQNLSDITDIRFGGGKSGAATFVLKTATSLTVIVPADATDGTICLTNSGGMTCTTTAFTVAK